MVGILRRWFDGKDVHIGAQYTENMQMPAIVARADPRSGIQAFGNGDDRFMRTSVVSINCFSSGPAGDGLGADKECSQVAESAQLAMRTALSEQWVIAGVGHLAHIQLSRPFFRAQDWQTSNSIVQYATLPHGVVRYEGVYRILIRPPAGGSGNPFLPTN